MRVADLINNNHRYKIEKKVENIMYINIIIYKYKYKYT